MKTQFSGTGPAGCSGYVNHLRYQKSNQPGRPSAVRAPEDGSQRYDPTAVAWVQETMAAREKPSNCYDDTPGQSTIRKKFVTRADRSELSKPRTDPFTTNKYVQGRLPFYLWNRFVQGPHEVAVFSVAIRFSVGPVAQYKKYFSGIISVQNKWPAPSIFQEGGICNPNRSRK